MAYDWVRRRIVLFGGAGQFGLLSDTWEWDGKNWTQVWPAVSPPHRRGHALAYDFKRQKIVLFGGEALKEMSDTWEWDGKNWTQMKTTAAPVARHSHTMAYDIARNRTVLFGGFNVLLRLPWPRDTWEWDGKNWMLSKLNSRPFGRQFFAMAYDWARGQSLIFGGLAPFGRQVISNETWTWNGQAWTLGLPSLSPSPRTQFAMTYDVLRQRIVLFGGLSKTNQWLNDTYEWDGKNWARANPVISPPKRRQHAMAYDAARRQVVLFGGRANNNSRLNDTWLYGLKKTPGRFTSYGTGCGTPAVTLSAAPASVPTIGRSFLLDSRNLPQASTVAIMAFGASRTKFGLITLPLNLSPFGMPGCFLYQSTELLVPYPVKNGSGQFSLPIPFNVQLIAATVFAQALIVAPNANSAGLLSSNGGAILIGN